MYAQEIGGPVNKAIGSDNLTFTRPAPSAEPRPGNYPWTTVPIPPGSKVLPDPQPGASQVYNLADLKSVRGIGPKREARLKAAGINDLGKLARTPVNEVAALAGRLRRGVHRDADLRRGWKQGRRLADANEKSLQWGMR